MAFRKRINLPPGSLVYVGDRPAAEMDLSIITYDSKSAQMKQLSAMDNLLEYKDDSKITWINITGLKDVDSIKRLGDLYNIHQLSIEDILNTEQQPKLEIFDEYKFMTIKKIQRDKDFHHNQENKKKSFSFFRRKKGQEDEQDEFLIDQISIIIMKSVIITFQEIVGATFDGIRRRILSDIGEIRKMGIEYLAYSIIDAIVDEYFLTLNHLEDDVEDFEDRATKTSDDTFIEGIQDTKKYLLKIKRAISPLKENMSVFYNHGWFFKTEELKPFMQDLSEHLNHAISMVDNLREWLSNIMDVNLSVLSHQMNKVMKVLAMISTIFIPLTFIAGIYGMNFEFMPELRQELGYPIVLGIMGLIGLTMAIFFKIRRWF